MDCSTHVIDVTNIIDTNVNLYDLEIAPVEEVFSPEESNLNLRYTDYTLVVHFYNNNLPIICSNVYLNNLNITDSITMKYNNIPSVNTLLESSYTLVMGSMMHLLYDGSYIYVNNDSIGLVGSNPEHTYWQPQSFATLNGNGITG